MALFAKKSSTMDVIRCDEPSYLIWKWRPDGAALGSSRRENAIRWGSSLRVKDGSVAVLAYTRPDGFVYDYIEGPADMILETANLPVLASLIGRLYDGGSPFQAEVYFINLAELIQVRFGVPLFDVFDPRFMDFGVPTAVRGTISFKIADYQEFIRLHRLDDFDLSTFQGQIKDAVSKAVKRVVTNAPAEHAIPVLQIERKIQEINDLVESGLRQRLCQDFGISVSGIDIAAIEIDKASDGYRQLKSVTLDVSAASIQAQTAVNIKEMQDVQRIRAEHSEAVLKAQREEAQFAQRIQTQSEHFTTHQLNQQAAVGMAGAEALGRMGGGAAPEAAGGWNPAGMAAGMAVGGAIGQNMAGMIGRMMSGMQQAAPPPAPGSTLVYHVVVDGQAHGPFSEAALMTMAAEGHLSQGSLVWKPGMPDWVQACRVPELQKLFPPVPPPTPPETSGQ